MSDLLVVLLEAQARAGRLPDVLSREWTGPPERLVIRLRWRSTPRERDYGYTAARYTAALAAFARLWGEAHL